MGEGLTRVFGAALAGNLTAEQVSFLRKLAAWNGVASPQDIGPQTSQAENGARQKCKRQKLVTYEDGYWRLTDLGRVVLARLNRPVPPHPDRGPAISNVPTR